MMTEIFNIDYHRKRLTVRALNAAATQKDAAKLLGITPRTVGDYVKQYGIKWGGKKKGYYIPNHPEFNREINPETIQLIKIVSDRMNALGKELSNYLKV